MRKARDYQQFCLDEIKVKFSQGKKKVLVVAPTGTGKGFIITEMAKGCESKGKKFLFIVRGRNLVDQTYKMFIKNGIDCGVIMANHWAVKHSALVKIASIDTLKSRGEREEFDLVCIDEAHLLVSDADIKALESISCNYSVGFTATPWQKQSMEHLANDIIQPINAKTAISRGFLAPAVYFGAKPPDLKGVKKSGDDWNQGQLEERMSVLQGDIVDFWIKNGERRPTMFFGVNVNHSKEVCKEFIKNGVKAVHVDANVSLSERALVIQQIENKEIEVICSVGTMTTGVDIPIISCIILGRPTQSFNLIKQIVGRGSRPIYAQGFPLNTDEERVAAIAAGPKPNFYIFDHGNCVSRHGYFYEITPEIVLNGVKEVDTGPKVSQCPLHYVYYTGRYCHQCGQPEENENEVKSDVETDINKSIQRLAQFDPNAAEILEFIQSKKLIAKKMKYKSGWIYYQIKDQIGEEFADILYPNHKRAMMYARKAKRQ